MSTITAQPGSTTRPITPLARVRPGAAVALKLIVNGDTVSPHQYQLLRIDPRGATVRVSEEACQILTGVSFDVELTIGDQNIRLADVTGIHLVGEEGADLLYLCWAAQSGREHEEEEQPARWQCDKHVFPTCVVDNPYELYGKLCFRVESLSRNELCLLSGKSPGLLVPGMKLNGQLQFPGLGQEAVTLELQWVRPGIGREFHLGARIVEASPNYHACAGQYVFQYVDGANVPKIKGAGLSVPSIAGGVCYDFAQSTEDYRDVLKLRKETYRWAQLTSHDLKLEDLGDEYDARANILIARHQGKCVGSLRIVFPGPNDHPQQAEYITLPDFFPPNEQIAEVTRICIDPNYRKGDLILGMLKLTILTVLQSGRSWVLGGAEDAMLPFYQQSFGAKVIGPKFEWKPGGVTHEINVFIVNLLDYLNQAGVSQAAWNLIAPDVISFAQRNNIAVNRLAEYGGHNHGNVRTAYDSSASAI